SGLGTRIKHLSPRGLDMDEHAYLALLEHLYGDPLGSSPDWTADERRWNLARREQFGDDSGEFPSKEEVRHGRITYMRRFLVDPLMEVLPPEDLKKLVNVPVGLLNVRSLNAQAFRAPNLKPIITLNQGLLSLISYWW